MNIRRIQIVKIFISILSLFGIIFLALLIHEYTHVIQSKNPVSICYSYQQNDLMYVTHEGYGDSFEDFKTYTEKWAHIIEKLINIILAFLFGVTFVLYYGEFKQNKG